MSRGSEAVRRWRERTKQRMVDAFGGECCVCGYSRSLRAFDFHHRDPSQKEFHFGAIRANPQSWSAIVEELRKCVLVCNRCHAEIHDGLIEVPSTAPSFNEQFAEYKTHRTSVPTDECPVCGQSKPTTNLTCSWKCAGSLHGKVRWETVDLIELRKTKTFMQIGDMLGVSEAAVRKRWQKLQNEFIPTGPAW